MNRARMGWLVRGLASVGLLSLACAPIAEFRQLERRVSSLDRRFEGPTDQQARLAELGAELADLRNLVADLRGSIEELEFAIGELRERAAGAPVGGLSDLGPAGPGPEGAIQEYPGGGEGGSAFPGGAGPQGAAGPGAVPGAPASEVRSYEEAFRAYRAGDHTAAIDRFQAFLQTYPSSDYADNALFWLGESYLRVGDHERAVLTFEDVVKRYPDGGKVPDALYRQGIALIELGARTGESSAYRSAAREIFERIVREYPNSERVSEARRQLERLGT